MKKVLLSLVFTLTSFLTIACSCAPFYSFCEYKTIYNPDLILSAEIIDTNQHGIRLKKLHVIEGNELRDTIPVWNDTDFVCTGTVSMRATQIGQVGDTVIVMLPRIDSVYTTWGVIGDYRTPIHLCGRAFIKIENDTLSRSPHYYFIGNQPPAVVVERPSYNDFLTYYNQYNNCNSLREGDFTYKPFPETAGTYWVDYEDVSSLQQSYHYQYRITKDTTIDSKVYHKLQRTTRHEIYHSGSNVSYSQETFGYFRNDSINKKVYVRLKDSTSDALFYDFNLQMGDTLKSTYFYDSTINPRPMVVDSIQFVRISGNLHRALFFTQNCDTDTLIEGIGWSAGAFMKSIPCFLGASYTLECLSVGGRSYYPDTAYSCDLITGVEKNAGSIQNKINVFPNPIEEYFQIDSPISFEEIQLYNNKGQLVKSLRPKNNHWKLNVPSGIYFLRFESEEGQLFHKKIIKH